MIKSAVTKLPTGILSSKCCKAHFITSWPDNYYLIITLSNHPLIILSNLQHLGHLLLYNSLSKQKPKSIYLESSTILSGKRFSSGSSSLIYTWITSLSGTYGGSCRHLYCSTTSWAKANEDVSGLLSDGGKWEGWSYCGSRSDYSSERNQSVRGTWHMHCNVWASCRYCA